MSIQPRDIRFPAERIHALDYVHRVERDPEAQEFGQKNQDQRRQKKKAPTDAEEELPHDVIEVSSDYSSTDKASPKAALQTATQSPVSPQDRTSPPPDVKPIAALPPDRHLDIKV